MHKAIPFIIAAIALGGPLAHAQPKAPQRSTGVASEPGKAVAVSVVEATATVVAINTATRTVTLKRADGHLVEVVCGDEVKNFAQISVGDNVKVSYQEALTLELKKTRAPAGCKRHHKRSARGAGRQTRGSGRTRDHGACRCGRGRSQEEHHHAQGSGRQRG